MQRMLTIKAVPGRTVHDPEDNSLVTDAAKNVPSSIFWRRRLAAGDVVEVTATARNTAPVEPAKPAEPEQPAAGRKSK